MSRSGVFAIRVGYEGEGGTALREQSLTERQPDNSEKSGSKSNTGAGEI